MTEQTATKRPTFLTVICVLSFIGGAIGLWSGYSTAFTDSPKKDLEEAEAQILEVVDSQGPDAPMIGLLESGLELQRQTVLHAKAIGYYTLGSSLLGLIGVWLMWCQLRSGFWWYTASTVIGWSSTYYFLGFGDGLFTHMALILGVIMSLTFVILYAVNLKHMR